MADKTIKKLPYIFSIIFQGIFLLTTIINLIYDIIKNSVSVWSLTIAHIFIPYLKYTHSGHIFDLFVLGLFLCISVISYIFSIKELLDSRNKKLPFLILNYLWNILGFWTFGAKIGGVYVMDIFSLIYYCLFFIFIVTVIPLKWKEHKSIANVDISDNSENPLLKKFDFLPKSYAQIVRTAKGAPVVEISIFLIMLFFKYIGEIVLEIVNILYLFTVVFAIIIFIGTISDYRFFIQSGNKSNRKHTLSKLNTMQIVSFILFVTTYFLF